METWFHATGADWSPSIQKVEVDKCTKNSVYIRGFRNARITSSSAYFPTWEEAHEHLLKVCENNLNAYRRLLERSQGYFGNVKGMKNPDAA